MPFSVGLHCQNWCQHFAARCVTCPVLATSCWQTLKDNSCRQHSSGKTSQGAPDLATSRRHRAQSHNLDAIDEEGHSFRAHPLNRHILEGPVCARAQADRQ